MVTNYKIKSFSLTTETFCILPEISWAKNPYFTISHLCYSKNNRKVYSKKGI